MIQKTSSFFMLYSASAAFLLWGGWAFLMNKNAGLVNGLISGLTQGVASVVMTLIIVHLVNWFFHQLSTLTSGLIVAPLLTVAISGTSLLLIHLSVGTANIIATIFPPTIVATFFSYIVAYKLYKQTNSSGESIKHANK